MKSKKLEIGPGKKRQPGFTTVDVDLKADADFCREATNLSGFADNQFEIVFASHILEHIPWYQSEKALREWARVLRPGGRLEVWVPNGLEIARNIVRVEADGKAPGMKHDKWRRFNKEGDPYRWANGRIFTYGDGKGTVNHPNWHRALFTPKSLRALLEKVGLAKVRRLDPKTERRGTGHGWIDMGFLGMKP